MRNQPFSQLTEDWVETSAPGATSRYRPLLLAGAILLLQVPIVLRLIHVQGIIADRFVTPWETPSTETVAVPPNAGRILTRDGIVLAQDEVRYDVAVEYRWLEKPLDPVWIKRQISRELNSKRRKDPRLREEVKQRLLEHQAQLIESLAAVTGLESGDITARMASIQRRIEGMQASVERQRQARLERQEKPFDWSQGLTGISRLIVDELTRPPDRFSSDPIILKEELESHVVIPDVQLRVVAAIQSQPERFRGVTIQPNSRRTYPQGALAAHVVGVSRQKKSEETGQQARLGESGIEKSYHERLAGLPGQVRKTRDRHGEVIREEAIVAQEDGQDVTLTIDFQLQQLAEQLLDQALYPPPRSLASGIPIPRGGCLLAMDVRTGDLLTLATSPRVPLNVQVQPSAEEWQRIIQDPAQPLFNRATQMALPPGAVFQFLTALAALQSQVASSDEVFQCQGYLDRPDELRCRMFAQLGVGHGQLLFNETLTQSCQVSSYEMARRLGPDELREWAVRFGFGSRTGIDLPGEASGKLPTFAPLDPRRPVVSGEALQFAVGQGGLLVTPLQIARFFAAIANGGHLVTPHVAQSLSSAEPQSPAGWTRVPGVSPETLAVLRQALNQSVSDPRGIAHGAVMTMLNVSATCGTGSVAGKSGHSWFVGYAPAEQPRVVVVLVLEEGGPAELSTPLFRDFFGELLGAGELRPSP